jgi:hypothetical protein
MKPVLFNFSSLANNSWGCPRLLEEAIFLFLFTERPWTLTYYFTTNTCKTPPPFLHSPTHRLRITAFDHLVMTVTEEINLRSEILKTLIINNTVSWDVTWRHVFWKKLTDFSEKITTSSSGRKFEDHQEGSSTLLQNVGVQESQPRWQYSH